MDKLINSDLPPPMTASALKTKDVTKQATEISMTVRRPQSCSPILNL